MRKNYSNKDDVDLKKLFLKYQSRWPLFAICIALSLGAAYAFNTLSEPVYVAKTTVLISEESMSSPLMPDLAQYMGRESWHNEKAILQSHSLVEKALQNMVTDVSYYQIERIFGLSTRREIYTDAPFRVKWNKNHPQYFEKSFRVKILSEHRYELEGIKEATGSGDRSPVRFGNRLEGHGHSFWLELVASFDKEQHTDKVYEFVIHDNRELTTRYLDNLNVEAIGIEYSVVEITFEATNQIRALDFVSNLTDMYIYENIAEKNRTAQNTIEFVDDQLVEVSEKLESTERSLQQFRQRHQVMEVGPVATRLSQELEELDRQKSVEQVKRQYYDLLMEYIRDDVEFTEVFGPSALGIDDPVLNSYLMDLSKLHNERARMLVTTTISTPSVLAIEENIRHSKANLQENIQSLKAANDIMITELNQRIGRIEQRINQLPNTERELINIQRMFNLNETTYNFLLEKRSEAGIGLASMVPDHKVVDPARSDDIVSPKKILNFSIALGIGMILPFFFLVIRNFFSNRIIDLEEVSKIVDYPIVGLIPHYPKINKLQNPNPGLFDENHSSVVEAFRSMRSNLIRLAPKTKSKLIVVTSTREHEGKTFTALNLAGSLYLLNRKTVYINADMRKPSYSLNGNINTDGGLSKYLEEGMNLDELIKQSAQKKNLYLISGGNVPSNAAELLESEAMDQLLEKLKSFEYIVIDTPPVGLVSDAMPLLIRANIVIYMLRHGYSQNSDLEFLRDLTRSNRLRKVAIAINDVKGSGRAGYGYGYGYGLGYGIGYGKDKQQENKEKSLL